MIHLTKALAVMALAGTPLARGGSGKIWYVDLFTPASQAQQDGGSWGTAFDDLQEALAVLSAGDQVWIAGGPGHVYKPSLGTRSVAFDIDVGAVEIHGSLPAGAPNLSFQNTATSPTTLSGDIGVPNNSADNSYNVVQLVGVHGPDTVIDGCIIEGGNANAGGSFSRGAGMRVEGANNIPTIRGVTFRNNASTNRGGGLYYVGSGLIEDCRFDGNATAGQGGGGAYFIGGSPVVRGCTFAGNSSSSLGGGLLLASGTAGTVEDCTFLDNSAVTFGGGAHLALATLTDCVFEANGAGQAGGGLWLATGSFSGGSFFNNTAGTDGGGLHLAVGGTTAIVAGVGFFDNSAVGRGGGVLTRGPLQVRDCRFRSNIAMGGGAVAGATISANLELVDCMLEANAASLDGGGVALQDGNAHIAHSRFLGNTASLGGGMSNSGSGSIEVDQTSFHGNQSTGDGGAIASNGQTLLAIRQSTIAYNDAESDGLGVGAGGGVWGAGNGMVEIANSVLWGNTDGSSFSMLFEEQLFEAGGLQVAVDHSIIEDFASSSWGGSGNSGADPLFVSSTATPGQVGFDLRPQANSPAIDAGSLMYLPSDGFDVDGNGIFDSFLQVDLGGGTRVLGSQVDVGAFEHGNTPIPLVYCVAKPNSENCLPAIGFAGAPSAAGAPFTISVDQLINNKPGLMIYGFSAISVPFMGGTLCLAPPRRTALQSTGGSTPPSVDCTGTMNFDFAALIQSGADPQLVASQQVNAQFWYRDAPASFGVGLSDALHFIIAP